MKNIRWIFLILAGAMASVCHAQVNTRPGWFRAQPRTVPPAHSASPSLGAASVNTPTTECVAEAVTPEIQALARGLENDPLRIFNYVHDHIRYVLYFGSKKGAQLTLLEKSGNDFDQCALLT